MIPSGTQFIGFAETVNLKERKSATVNSETAVYTINEFNPYKSFTALLTQNGGDGPATRFGDGEIVKGISYYIDANPDNEDLTLVGAPNNEPGTSFIATETIYGAYTNSVVLLYNEGAPVATVLENTIGNLSFVYNGVGSYYADLSFLNPDDPSSIQTYSTVIVGTQNPDSAGVSGYIRHAYIDGAGNLFINTSNYDTDNNDNGVLFLSPIEIRVYN